VQQDMARLWSSWPCWLLAAHAAQDRCFPEPSPREPCLPLSEPCTHSCTMPHYSHPQGQWRHLPYCYNGQKRIKVHHPDLWDMADIYVIHYGEPFM